MIIREGVETRKTDINTKMTFVPLRTEQSLMSLSTLAKKYKKAAEPTKKNCTTFIYYSVENT